MPSSASPFGWPGPASRAAHWQGPWSRSVCRWGWAGGASARSWRCCGTGFPHGRGWAPPQWRAPRGTCRSAACMWRGTSTACRRPCSNSKKVCWWCCGGVIVASWVVNRGQHAHVWGGAAAAGAAVDCVGDQPALAGNGRRLISRGLIGLIETTAVPVRHCTAQF